MQTSEVLNKAADLIEERGWAQGGGDHSDGGVCAVEAIAAVGGVNSFHAPLAAMRNYLALPPRGLLQHWNDRPDRSQEGVVGAFRSAALIEQVREGAPISVLATTNA